MKFIKSGKADRRYMRIYIKDEGKTFWIPAPLWVLKIATGRFARSMALKYTPKEQKKYVEAIDFKELSKAINILSQYKGLEIVNIESKDGSKVNIRI